MSNNPQEFLDYEGLAHLMAGVKAQIRDAKQACTDAKNALDNHAKETNPHKVDKSQVGLSNVDNTSDVNKPVSTDQAAAIAEAKKAGTDAQAALTTHNTSTDAHNDLRLDLKALSDRINAALDSDDTTLDELSEIVAYIKSNKSLIDAITTSKVNVADIVNDLATNVANKPLSAAQGVALKKLIDDITTSLNNHATDKNNPHGVTPEQIGAAPAPFYVMLSGNTTNGYAVDKTFAEITTAFSAGQDMRLLEYGSYMYQYELVWAAGSSAVFACNKGEYSYVVTVKSDNTVTKATFTALPAGHDYNINAHSDIRADIREILIGLNNAQGDATSALNKANGAVPTTRKVNNKELSADITLSASDVKALPAAGGTLTGALEINASSAKIQLKNPNANGRYFYEQQWADGSVDIRSQSSGQDYAALRMLPESDGVNFLRAMRQVNGTPENFIILHSGNTKSENWTFTLEDGSTVTKAVYVG